MLEKVKDINVLTNTGCLTCVTIIIIAMIKYYNIFIYIYNYTFIITRNQGLLSFQWKKSKFI